MIVWLYIMFCATNRPAPDATTDLGVSPPVMTWVFSSRRSAAASPSSGGDTTSGATIVVVATRGDVDTELRWGAVASAVRRFPDAVGVVAVVAVVPLHAAKVAVAASAPARIRRSRR